MKETREQAIQRLSHMLGSLSYTPVDSYYLGTPKLYLHPAGVVFNHHKRHTALDYNSVSFCLIVPTRDIKPLFSCGTWNLAKFPKQPLKVAHSKECNEASIQDLWRPSLSNAYSFPWFLYIYRHQHRPSRLYFGQESHISYTVQKSGKEDAWFMLPQVFTGNNGMVQIPLYYGSITDGFQNRPIAYMRNQVRVPMLFKNEIIYKELYKFPFKKEPLIKEIYR